MTYFMSNYLGLQDQRKVTLQERKVIWSKFLVDLRLSSKKLSSFLINEKTPVLSWSDASPFTRRKLIKKLGTEVFPLFWVEIGHHDTDNAKTI